MPKLCPHGFQKYRCYKCRVKRILDKANPKAAKKRIKKDLDTIFSLNVRLRGCGDDLSGRCISCRRAMPFDKLQNGHFVARSISGALYFSHDNCRPQCVQCNKFKEGNTLEYRFHLIKEIGITKVEQMELIGRSTMFKALNAVEMKARIMEEIKELKQHILRTGLELNKEAKRVIRSWERNNQG